MPDAALLSYAHIYRSIILVQFHNNMLRASIITVLKYNSVYKYREIIIIIMNMYGICSSFVCLHWWMSNACDSFFSAGNKVTNICIIRKTINMV